MKTSFSHLRAGSLTGLAFCLTVVVTAQEFSPPFEIRQQETLYNFHSRGGMPISPESGNPPGSDGRAPTSDDQAERELTLNPPTDGQFNGFVSFGAVVKTRPGPSGSSGYATYSAYAQEVLPRGGPSGQQIHIARAQVGAPYISRQVAFLFGGVVQVPEVDEQEEPLSERTPPVSPEDYWIREPHWPSGEIEGGIHVDAPYYWSRHARAVFAIRPGPIEIEWRRSAPLSADELDEYPDDYEFADDGGVAVIDGRVYPLLRQHYIVSGSAAKTPRRMYWTEGTFGNSGITVDVPEGLTVNFIYTDNFPRTVEEAYEEPGSSPPVPPGEGGETFSEKRTIFYNQDTGNIHAFNWQGRILLELLGDNLDGDRRQHLGIEIIDVTRRVNPADVTVELGERLTAWPDGSPDDSDLMPKLLLRSSDHEFAFQHHVEGARLQVYAIRKTRNVNDFLMHWTEEGLEGLQWPFRFVRYRMVWPDDITRYSHYMRPTVAGEEEARETAVDMPMENTPIIEYQDSLDRPRAKLTETFAFYTYLEPQYPAHRTLLRFTSGENIAFERVFSWLADDLSVDFSGNLWAHNRLAEMLGLPAAGPDEEPPPKMLAAWIPELGTFSLTDPFAAPRVETRTVNVGQRIEAPIDESPPSPGEPYWSGHIREDKGTSFNPFAYVDPFDSGFEAANEGAIIPVNAIPGKNELEVWWFRSNRPDEASGFQPVYWPSVIGRYSVQWPQNAPEIVLASNLGSGALSDAEADGLVYTQNDPDLAGYNPNEEHALMIDGRAYALRDDLNIIEGEDYSSEPYVLIEYIDEDDRPAMTAFRVLREKPEEGWVFDYAVEAGTILPPPMPLPLLPPPVDGIGADAFNYNVEPVVADEGDLPVNWSEEEHPDGSFGHYRRFTILDRNDAFWVYRGLHAGPPPLEAGTYDAESGDFEHPVSATVRPDEPFRYVFHASHRAEALWLEPSGGTALPDWLTIVGATLEGTPEETGEYRFSFVLFSLVDGSSFEMDWTLVVNEEDPVQVQEEMEISSINPYTGTQVTHVGRPPHLAADPGPENSFTMRFYYKTREGFAWPGHEDVPPVDSIVPYLRPETATGGFEGEPDSSGTASIDIVYRPYWPGDTPGMRLGDTLMTAKEGLPAVRGQSSLQVLYQQSVARDMEAQNASAVLHDSTCEKEISIADVGLGDLPSGVRTDRFQGRLYFPDLPPHLVERFFFEPLRGEDGHLVFKGELREEVLGADYLLLNVARGEDLQAIRNLCPAGDADKAAWDQAVEGLVAMVETFHENPAVPGDFVADESQTVMVGIGDVVEIGDHNIAVDSYTLSASGPGTGYVTLMSGGGAAFTPSGDPVSVHIIRIEPIQFPGELKVIEATNPLSEELTMQHSADLGGRFDEYEYDWRIAAPVDGLPPVVDEGMAQWSEASFGTGLPRYLLGGASVRTLSDNYLVVRYRPLHPDHPLYVEDPESLENPDDAWSPWTSPMLAEGWIKRVLAGINPFQQRTDDLFNNRVSTDVSMLTQAGPRWEGDIALNIDTIDDYGLIEIYETVLRRGRMLSIEAGINYGPANDALLLAAGYLNDLYMFVGNEAWADAANPTIGIGTADETHGDVATSLFAFKGQVPNLLEEELALLRGRDDFLLPGVEVEPIYNRLVWNYTRGIDSGEVIYAINYNIQEKPDGEPTGIIDASDAARMFPQGHGDAYGHYLTALKGYYSLLMNENFDWVPRIEAVLVLGQPVSVDYFDERKFAAAAAAVARAGQHTFDLTWRRDFESGDDTGWEHFADIRENTQTGRTRYWGMDHWATRTGQGAYVNWVVGNAILPAEDTEREGIQKIDRTTVPELIELPVLMGMLQTNLNNAEAGLTPLGLPEGGIAFDIDPLKVVGADGQTHFEQIYDRALIALNNAVAAFDDAKDVTRMMRSEEDSLAGFQTTVAQQEHAFTNALIELYGTPYPDDIGPGRTYVSGYDGPDLLHFMYVDLPELPDGLGQAQTDETRVFELDIQKLPESWQTHLHTEFDFFEFEEGEYILDDHFIQYELGPHGFFSKPENWTGRRRSPGRVQQAVSELIAAHQALSQALADAEFSHESVARQVRLFNARVEMEDNVEAIERRLMLSADLVKLVELGYEAFEAISTVTNKTVSNVSEAILEGIPTNFIAGLAAGGDVASAARAGIKAAGGTIETASDWTKVAKFITTKAFSAAQESFAKWRRFNVIDNTLKRDQQLKEQVAALGAGFGSMAGHLETVNQRLRALDDAERAYRAAVAQGDRILEEREIFRRRSASVIQGYRTRDAAFRIFRNEKLERYKTLFDLAARYTFLAAQAYDYETGLLHTPEGRAFIDRIVAARALGVVSNGEPQFAGSATGDPGLSSILAEMMGDWSVLRGRLGFNNPDAYGTTVSLRREKFRIRPGEESRDNWQDILQASWRSNILDDADVRRHAMQAGADGFPVPGLVISFSTTIAPGRNLFGHPLAAGDHAFSPSSFATKIFAAGVALEGYQGMSDPGANTAGVEFAGGNSPDDPDAHWLNSDALAATPYIYLIPVGADSMRSPPLGDAGGIRTWQVNDVTVPLPFNIGASQLSTLQWWQSSDFLTEDMFSIRKHQAFRPVSSADVFGFDLYGSDGSLQPSQFTNNRLIGRSVWNSEWKLVIPGDTLLSDADEGLRRFIKTVHDIKLHFVTYSYSGN